MFRVSPDKFSMLFTTSLHGYSVDPLFVNPMDTEGEFTESFEDAIGSAFCSSRGHIPYATMSSSWFSGRFVCGRCAWDIDMSGGWKFNLRAPRRVDGNSHLHESTPHASNTLMTSQATSKLQSSDIPILENDMFRNHRAMRLFDARLESPDPNEDVAKALSNNVDEVAL